MHRTALTIALVGLLVFAGIGYFSGLRMLTCTVRSLAGAAGLYLAARVAMRMALAIFVSAVMRSSPGASAGRKDREHN
jgi:hypothetical protein